MHSFCNKALSVQRLAGCLNIGCLQLACRQTLIRNAFLFSAASFARLLQLAAGFATVTGSCVPVLLRANSRS